MSSFVLFDTETTGTEEEDRIVQVGAIILEKKNSEVYDELCSTDVPIKLGAMETHHITEEMIKEKPSYKETKFCKRLEELNNPSNYLIAHNIDFDLKMIQKEGFIQKINLIDTLQCSKHLIKDVESYRLQHLRYALGLYKKEEEEAKKHNIEIKAHDAIGDVLIMKLLLSRLVEEITKSEPAANPIAKLLELKKKDVLVETFVFGKYKGESIKEICRKDSNYIRWIKNNMELDRNMIFTLETYK